MNTKAVLNIKDVEHIASLAKLPINKTEIEKLTDGFNEVLEVVDKLFELNVEGIKPADHITGLTNIFRDDVVDEKRILSQDNVLSNSKSHYRGYFVVDQILEE